MVTITLHDRDVLAVLVLINAMRQAGQTTVEDAALDRVVSTARCALLLCDCEKAKEDAL